MALSTGPYSIRAGTGIIAPLFQVGAVCRIENIGFNA